jgi:hypothetical protein
MRRKGTTESFGKLDKFGYLRYYGPVTSLTHVVLKLRRLALYWIDCTNHSKGERIFQIRQNVD